jgi:5-methyltetrahydrofolate--homocysteine methyltransferase
MPVGAIGAAGKTLFEIVRRCRSELRVNTVCGASNISFGLPARPSLNGTFLAMAIAAGMPCAITNSLEHEVRQAVLAADVLQGHDEDCMQWLAAQRQNSSDKKGGSTRRRRRG